MVWVIRRKRFLIKFKNFLSQLQIKICDFNHWYIPAALPVHTKYHSAPMTVLNWALGIFYQNQFFKLGNYKEHLARKLYRVQVPVLSQTPFWPKGIWHSSNNTRKLSFEQTTPGHWKHWVISLLDRAFCMPSVRACFLLVLAGIQHPLFLFHFHTSFEYDARSSLWGYKDSLGPSGCRHLPQLLLVTFSLLGHTDATYPLP